MPMFAFLGRRIARQPWLFVLIWLAAVGAGVVWDMRSSRPPANDTGSFLPEEAPHNRGMAMLMEAFPELASRSQIVVVGYRPEGLAKTDLSWLNELAMNARRQIPEATVLSPMMPFFDRRLVSNDDQAAMVLINLKSAFISEATAEAVTRVEALTDAGRPRDLLTEITGIAGIGRDYAAATSKAMDRTTWVTVAAVLIILVLIYRSPVGALVPLVSIGASVYLAMVLLAMLLRVGWQVSTMERIFVVVLLFGAGVDYALFWISRYREALGEREDFEHAAVVACTHTSPAILASAGTTICGLSMMLTADLVPSRNAGKVLALVLVVSLLAALTLSPAMAVLLRRGLFWPVGLKGRPNFGQRLIWPALAKQVVRRPGAILLAASVLLLLPALAALRIEMRYDSLSELPPDSSSERGYHLLAEHFRPGQLFSTQMLLVFDELPDSDAALLRYSRELGSVIRDLPGVEDVYSLEEPLGHEGTGVSLPGVEAVLRKVARRFYVSETHRALRLEVLIEAPPFSTAAMAVIERAREVSEAKVGSLVENPSHVEVFTTGLTPYIIDVRDVSRRDQVRVMCLATVVIALIVFAIVRDLPLTLFMILATWLTYGATLTFTHICFVHVLGEGGIDWKVQLIVFVIVVAVGQDYNIFLVTRLLHESREVDHAEATRRAIVTTGSVISGCGIIMAATLGSLYAGQLLLLRQVGMALALGILIDTFLVRPLLIPGFFLLWRGGRRSPVVPPAGLPEVARDQASGGPFR